MLESLIPQMSLRALSLVAMWDALPLSVFSNILKLLLGLMFLIGPVIVGGRRPSLRAAMLALAGFAIFLASIAHDRKLGKAVLSVDILSPNQQAGALAREVVSQAVLDDALTSGLSRVGRFANSADPRADLRAILMVNTAAGSSLVRLSTEALPLYQDEWAILDQVARSCVKVLGPKRAQVLGGVSFAKSGEWSLHHGLLLVAAWFSWWCCCLVLSARARRRSGRAGPGGRGSRNGSGSAGRVAPGDCSPRAPTDPGVRINAPGSSSHVAAPPSRLWTTGAVNGVTAHSGQSMGSLLIHAGS